MRSAKTHQIPDGPASWQEMPGGADFCEAIRQHLQPYLSKLYGLHLLKIGELSTEINTDSCPIFHQVNVGQRGHVQVIARPESLPFEAKSVDACLLAHTLAWSADPHRILREVDRVLIDDGWLLISSFNPFSFIGLGKCIPGMNRRVPWSGRMYSQMRLLDWLGLLNYEVCYRTHFFTVPGAQSLRKGIMSYFLTAGCLNVMVARKRTFPLTLQPARQKHSKARIRPAMNATRQLYSHNDHDEG